jgi:hypothetical protein
MLSRTEGAGRSSLPSQSARAPAGNSTSRLSSNPQASTPLHRRRVLIDLSQRVEDASVAAEAADPLMRRGLVREPRDLITKELEPFFVDGQILV